MTSVPSNAPTSSGKSLNASSSASLIHHQHSQLTSPSFESGPRRLGHHLAAASPSGRNNQSHKKQHRNSRKPRLLDEDAMAESGAIRNANSRRGQTNITHLMNITLPPRPQDYRTTFGRGTRRANIFGIGSGHHSIDKARYIHANYRFIVRPYGDYSQQAINADQHLNWDDVLQILASSVSQAASCPICLSHPVAPRMAKCGHIFCLPCLIRYMHSEDDTSPIPEKKARWKKCPICWDSIYMAETKPVRWYTGQEGSPPREGEDVVLRLVMRQPGSTLALPRDGAEALGKPEDIPWYFAAEATDYARVLKGSEDYMMEQYDNEISELRRQESEDELMFGEEPEWTIKAVNAIKEAKEKIVGIGNPPAIPIQPTEKKPKRQPIQYTMSDDDPDAYILRDAERSGAISANGFLAPLSPQVGAPAADTNAQQPEHQAPSAIRSPRKSHHPRGGRHEAHHPDEPYFFYQALLHYYLAPLDIRILKSAFGNFSSFPTALLPRVERVSTGHTVDDELRKRTKYLAHLPYGCEVGFLECNWTDVVPAEILNQFWEEIERRRKRNRDKEIREEKDRQRAEKAEDDLRWANARRRRPSVTQDSIPGDDFHRLAPSSLDASSASPPWPIRQGSSFATLASPSTSPTAPRTVWGTAMIAPTSPETRPQQVERDVDDGWLQSWEQELMAENELIAQLEASTIQGSGTVQPTTAGQGRKKKAKKITLMSTTARRAA